MYCLQYYIGKMAGLTNVTFGGRNAIWQRFGLKKYYLAFVFYLKHLP
jgi:hypothetical protein